MAGSQGGFVANCRVLVAADWHVEFAAAVDAPEAVVTGLVEIDEARRALDRVGWLVLRADFVIVVFAVLVLVFLQQLNERLYFILNSLPGADEIGVDIT